MRKIDRLEIITTNQFVDYNYLGLEKLRNEQIVLFALIDLANTIKISTYRS